MRMISKVSSLSFRQISFFRFQSTYLAEALDGAAADGWKGAFVADGAAAVPARSHRVPGNTGRHDLTHPQAAPPGAAFCIGGLWRAQVFSTDAVSSRISRRSARQGC